MKTNWWFIVLVGLVGTQTFMLWRDWTERQEKKKKHEVSLAQAREGEERGRGVPLSDLERLMRHYNISEHTARYWLTFHTFEELLPERGTGLI